MHFFQLFKNRKAIVSSWAVQKEEAAAGFDSWDVVCPSGLNAAQRCPVELSAMMEMFTSAPWLWSSWNMLCVTEEPNF